MNSEEKAQLLHIVIGGELKSVDSNEFRDLTQVELVGAYPDYASAHAAWKSRAQRGYEREKTVRRDTERGAIAAFLDVQESAVIDPTIVDTTDEVGRAAVTVTLPEGTPAGTSVDEIGRAHV